MKTAWLLLVFLCGALLPLQGGLNAKLAKSMASPIYASMICFIVGAITMALYVPFTKETFSWQ
ncbi:MAG TPA: DMT family transporter, partial [Niastella sp.]